MISLVLIVNQVVIGIAFNCAIFIFYNTQMYFHKCLYGTLHAANINNENKLKDQRCGFTAFNMHQKEKRSLLLSFRVSPRTSKFPRLNMWATSRTMREPHWWAVNSTPASLIQSFLLSSRNRRRCVCVQNKSLNFLNAFCPSIPFLLTHYHLSTTDHQEVDREEAGSDQKSLSGAFLF